LVKITSFLLPSLNFIEDGTDVVIRITNSFLSIKKSFQVVNGLLMVDLIFRVDKLEKTLRLRLLWTTLLLHGRWCCHEVVKGWLRKCDLGS
jgi:hypothetical protein